MGKKISKVDIQDGDVLLDLRESAKATKIQTEALKTSLELIDEAIKQIKKDAQGIKTGLFKTNPADAKNQKEFNDQVKQATNLVINEEKAQRAKLQTLKQLEVTKQAQIRTENLIKNQTTKTLTEYQKESRLLNELRNKYKDLAIQKKANTSEAKALLAQITPLDAKLKAIDKTVGQSQRNVGNYSSAFDGLKGKMNGLIGVAGQFGLALGGVALVRGAITTVAEFETQVADLSAVTGQTGKDLDFLKEKAIDFSKKYGESAASIATAFKLAGSARPELLKNGAAMADLAEKAIILSKASGDDVPTSIANLTGTLNAFNLPATAAGKVMDILANASKEGAQEIPYLTEAFTKFGGVAANAGIGIAESAAAVEILGLKIPEASIAGNNLKNIMIILQTQASKQGREFKGLTAELEMMKPKLKDVAALEAVFGKENILAAQTLIGQTDELKRFTGALDTNGTAQEQASIKSKTLAEAGKRLKSNIEGYVLEMLNGVDAAGGLAGAMDFLANNIEDIVFWIGKGIQVFIAYKGAMLAMKMKDRITEFVQFNKASKDGVSAMTEGASSAKKFGSALKGIGFGVAITLAFELIKAFYDIASGAEAARDAAARLDVQLAKSSKDAAARTSKRTEDVSLQIAELQRQRNENKITEKEFLAQKKALTEATKEEVKADIQKVNARKAKYIEEKKALELRIKTLALDGGIISNAAIRELGFELNQVNANIRGSNTRLVEYYKELGAVGEITKDLNSELIIEDTNLQATTKSTKEKAKAVEAYKVQLIEVDEVIRNLFDTDKVEKQLALQDERLKITSNIAVLEAEIALKKAEQSGDSKKIEAAEKAVLKAKIDAINTQLKIDLKNSIGDPAKQKELELQAELDILNLSKDKTAEIEKAKYEETKKWGDLTNQYLQRVLDDRISMLDKEIEASKKQQENLSEMANNGNINAQQSIAKQAQIQADAQAKKEKLERRKAQLAAVSTFIQTFLTERESGKSSTEAFAAASLDKITLETIISALPTFLEGSDRTQNVGHGVDGKGGFLSVLHPDEMVFTKEERQAMGGLTREQVIAQVQNSKVHEFGNIASSGWENVGLSLELNGLKTEMQEIKKAIIDKPVSNIELGAITQKTMEIIHSTKQGNRTTQSTYIVKG